MQLIDTSTTPSAWAPGGRRGSDRVGQDQRKAKGQRPLAKDSIHRERINGLALRTTRLGRGGRERIRRVRGEERIQKNMLQRIPLDLLLDS